MTKEQEEARERILKKFEEFNAPLHQAMKEEFEIFKRQREQGYDSSGSHMESWAFNFGGMK